MAELVVSPPITGISVTPGSTDGSTATLFGSGGTAWRDDSDATYVEMRQGVLLSGSYGWSEGTFTKIEISPQTAASARLRVRAAASKSSVVLNFGFQTSSQASWLTLSLTGMAVAPTWYTIPITTLTAEQVAGHFRAGSAGTEQVEVRKSGGTTAGDGSWWRIYELRLELVTVTAPGFHPCRQFPRADGLASSSARRHFPRAESWQAGSRWRGAYF